MGIDPMQMKAMVIQGMIDSLDSQDRAEKLQSIKTLGGTIGIGALTGLEQKTINALERVAKENDEEIKSAAEAALSKIKKNIPASKAAPKKPSTSTFAVGDMSALFPMPAKPEEKTTPKTKVNIKKSHLYILLISIILFVLCIVCSVVYYLGNAS